MWTLRSRIIRHPSQKRRILCGRSATTSRGVLEAYSSQKPQSATVRLSMWKGAPNNEEGKAKQCIGGDDVLLLYLAPFCQPHFPKCGNPMLGVKANRSALEYSSSKADELKVEFSAEWLRIWRYERGISLELCTKSMGLSFLCLVLISAPLVSNPQHCLIEFIYKTNQFDLPLSVLGVSSHRFLLALGVALPGVAWPGVTCPGVAWPGVTWPGVTWPGVASQMRVLAVGVAPGVAAPGVSPPLCLPGVSSQRLIEGVWDCSEVHVKQKEHFYFNYSVFCAATHVHVNLSQLYKIKKSVRTTDYGFPTFRLWCYCFKWNSLQFCFSLHFLKSHSAW